jgi:hypothetical protein
MKHHILFFFLGAILGMMIMYSLSLNSLINEAKMEQKFYAPQTVCFNETKDYSLDSWDVALQDCNNGLPLNPIKQ